MGFCARRLGLLVCLFAPATLAPNARAQVAPVGVPAGALRVELDGRMDIWDSQYLDGTRVPLGADLSSSALGRSLFPSLADADARIERITGITGYGLDLGVLATDVERDESRGYFGLSLGLTNAITIFGRIPLVRARVQSRMTLDTAGADAGVNPGSDAQATFFTQLDAALATLNTNISNGSYSGATLALAQSTLASGTSLNADLDGLLSDPNTASAFLPTGSSAAGTAITSRINALQTTLATDLGIAGFTATPSLPTEAVAPEEFQTFLTSAAGLRTSDAKLSFRGDAETGVALTLVDRWDRNGRRGGLRLAVQGLVRYPTGTVPAPDRLFTVGTGDGQTDIEGHATVDLGSGAFGVRLEGDYNRQLTADITARVAPPTEPFAGVETISVVRNDPGDITTLAARPFLRFAPSLALQGTVLHWSRGADEVSYATPADEIPGVDASVLAIDTKANATVLGIGITYANLGQLRQGGTGLPVEAGWSYERVVSAGGGRVPNKHSFTAHLRVYFGLF